AAGRGDSPRWTGPSGATRWRSSPCAPSRQGRSSGSATARPSRWRSPSCSVSSRRGASSSRPVCARPGARLLPALRHTVAGGAAARPPWPLMVETLQNLALGFSIALTPGVLFYAFAGCVVGTLVGVLPGIGPLAGISLLLPATFGLDATRAIVMLAGIYYGAMYGGSTTSILMRIPGEAASVMS